MGKWHGEGKGNFVVVIYWIVRRIILAGVGVDESHESESQFIRWVIMERRSVKSERMRGTVINYELIHMAFFVMGFLASEAAVRLQ